MGKNKEKNSLQEVTHEVIEEKKECFFKNYVVIDGKTFDPKVGYMLTAQEQELYKKYLVSKCCVDCKNCKK